MAVSIQIQAVLINPMLRKQLELKSHFIFLKISNSKFACLIFLHLFFKGLFGCYFNSRVCLDSYFPLQPSQPDYFLGNRAMILSHLMTPEHKPLGTPPPITARQELAVYSSKHVCLHLVTHKTDLLYQIP